jgi:hypothetical protein
METRLLLVVVVVVRARLLVLLAQPQLTLDPASLRVLLFL